MTSQSLFRRQPLRHHALINDVAANFEVSPALRDADAILRHPEIPSRHVPATSQAFPMLPKRRYRLPLSTYQESAEQAQEKAGGTSV